MKQITLDRAKKALKLIEEGVSLTRAAKAVKMKPRTLKKALKKLKVRTRKVKGRYRLLREVYKQKMDLVIYYMMAGWSATRACRLAGTTLKTMRLVTVELSKTKKVVKLLTKRKGGIYYRLNVFHVYGYHTVFYGRLMSLGEPRQDGSRKSPVPISGKQFPGPITRDMNDINFGDPNYYNVMWQLDFDPFSSTLLARDVIEHYPGPVMRALHSKLVDTLELFKIFTNCTGFSDTVECGIDERDTEEEYMLEGDFKKKAVKKDKGMFEVIVRSIKGDEHYPEPPLVIEFKHDLKKESNVNRRL